MKNSETSSGGIGFSGLLTIAFIVLKLCRVISWSWLWVLSPLWIPLSIVLLVLFGWALFKIPAVIKSRKRMRRIHTLIKEGHNPFSAEIQYNKENGIKSKWQQQIEELQKRK